METVRDLGEVELWQESLQRSLARRGRLPRSSPELARLRPARDLTDEDFMQEYAGYWRMRRDAAARRPLMPVVGVGGVSTIALLAVTLPGLLGGRSASARSQRLAYVDHSPRSLTRVARPSTRQSPDVNRPTRHALTAAPPASLATATTTHATATTTHATTTTTHATTTTTHATTTTPQPPTTTHAATATAAPTTRPVATTASDSPVRHAAADAQAVTPTSATTQSGVAATVARSTQAASQVSRPSGQPQGSGGATPGGPHHAHPGSSHSSGGSGGTGSGASGGAGVGSAPNSGGSSSNGRRSTAPGTSSGYLNPIAHASLTPERIDQGVDYSGSGKLTAIGAGRVTYVGTSNTGWPGAFIEFRLSGGRYAGRYVFYAESIAPVSGLHVGQRVRAGQAIATVNGGIEIGWGAGIGTETYAMQHGQWSHGMDSDNHPTPSGKSFSALIASLGGAPGKIEG